MNSVKGLQRHNITDGESDEHKDLFLNGFHDEEAGSVEYGVHCYRVGEYVIETTDQGTHVTAKFDTEEAAIDFMEGVE